jgi:uncharacterized membrane protein
MDSLVFYVCSAVVIAVLGFLFTWLRKENVVPSITVPIDGRSQSLLSLRMYWALHLVHKMTAFTQQRLFTRS